MTGKQIRLERLTNRETGNTILVPMDHGITVGPIPGLENLTETIDQVVQGGADAVLMHKGMVRHGHRGHGDDVGLVVHLSASTEHAGDPNHKVQCATVTEAVKLGADAVSVHVNLGAVEEAAMLEKFGRVSQSARDWGMPLIAMLYPRGPRIEDSYDSNVVQHAARLAAELGADMVKCPYTGDPESFRDVIDGCPIPVLIAGGPRTDDPWDVLEMVHGAIQAGARGISIGRNVFQAEDPAAMVRALAAIVHSGDQPNDAEAYLS